MMTAVRRILPAEDYPNDVELTLAALAPTGWMRSGRAIGTPRSLFHQLDAAIPGPSRFSSVVGDRFRIAEAVRRETTGVDTSGYKGGFHRIRAPFR
jgi:hypothetical protein